MDKVVALKKAIALCKQENCVCAVWEEGGVIATFRGSLSTVSLFGLVHVVFFSRAAGREFKKVKIGGVNFSATLVHASHGCAWWDEFFFFFFEGTGGLKSVCQVFFFPHVCEEDNIICLLQNITRNPSRCDSHMPHFL